MARLKIPDGHASVAHGLFSYMADDAGIIDTGDAPSEVVEALMKHAGCREATDGDVEAADARAVEGDFKAQLIETKADVLAELKRRNLPGVDGRNTLVTLRKLLAADDDRIAAEKTVADQKTAQQATADKLAADKAAADKAAADKAAAEKSAADKAAADAAKKTDAGAA